jgi:hypothetical protein
LTLTLNLSYNKPTWFKEKRGRGSKTDDIWREKVGASGGGKLWPLRSTSQVRIGFRARFRVRFRVRVKRGFGLREG